MKNNKEGEKKSWKDCSTYEWSAGASPRQWSFQKTSEDVDKPGKYLGKEGRASEPGCVEGEYLVY